jgi:hypothetical protein
LKIMTLKTMHQSRKKMPVREALNNFYFYHQN